MAKEEREFKKVKKHLCVIMPNKKAVKKTAFKKTNQ